MWALDRGLGLFVLCGVPGWRWLAPHRARGEVCRRAGERSRAAFRVGSAVVGVVPMSGFRSGGAAGAPPPGDRDDSSAGDVHGVRGGATLPGKGGLPWSRSTVPVSDRRLATG